jgi:transcriptional regulator with XRE-family HTH domain
MNIEIANRLVELRKKSGLSQEELAAKLGLSRQAVSKWERAEASPDTDNLICLAKLYGVSLDDLLDTDQSVDEIVEEQIKTETPDPNPKANGEANPSSSTASQTSSQTGAEHASTQSEKQAEGSKSSSYTTSEDKESFDSHGIHVSTADGTRVDMGFDGIHVQDGSGTVHQAHHVSVDMPSSRRKRFHVIQSIASGLITMLTVIAYLLCGFLISDSYYGWGCSWIVFFLIPLVPSFIEAVFKRKFCAFAFPILVTAVYLLLGMVWGLWNPYWVLFLTIPVYYILFVPIDKVIHDHHPDDIEVDVDLDDDDEKKKEDAAKKCDSDIIDEETK